MQVSRRAASFRPDSSATLDESVPSWASTASDLAEDWFSADRRDSQVRSPAHPSCPRTVAGSSGCSVLEVQSVGTSSCQALATLDSEQATQKIPAGHSGGESCGSKQASPREHCPRGTAVVISLRRRAFEQAPHYPPCPNPPRGVTHRGVLGFPSLDNLECRVAGWIGCAQPAQLIPDLDPGPDQREQGCHEIHYHGRMLSSSGEDSALLHADVPPRLPPVHRFAYRRDFRSIKLACSVSSASLTLAFTRTSVAGGKYDSRRCSSESKYHQGGLIAALCRLCPRHSA